MVTKHHYVIITVVNKAFMQETTMGDYLDDRRMQIERIVNDKFREFASNLVVKIRDDDNTLSIDYLGKKRVILILKEVEDDLDGRPTGYIKREIQKLIET